MIEQKNYTLKGVGDKLITADLSYRNYEQAVPITIFLHGFKGFKDWGAWPVAAQLFALKGLPFFKFNFSHNGTSPKNLTDFVDLEAFGKNTISKEIDEVGLVLDFIENKKEQLPFQWNGEFNIVGHSLGGSVALIRMIEDDRIQKCACWSAVSSFDRYLKLTDPETWKKEGVTYIENARTKQQMPLYYSFYEDILQHRGRFDIIENLQDTVKDLLIVHAENDETVKEEHADALYNAVAHAVKVIIENADHVYNVKHPLTEKKIPVQFAQLLDETIEFFKW